MNYELDTSKRNNSDLFRNLDDSLVDAIINSSDKTGYSQIDDEKSYAFNAVSVYLAKCYSKYLEENNILTSYPATFKELNSLPKSTLTKFLKSQNLNGLLVKLVKHDILRMVGPYDNTVEDSTYADLELSSKATVSLNSNVGEVIVKSGTTATIFILYKFYSGQSYRWSVVKHETHPIINNWRKYETENPEGSLSSSEFINVFKKLFNGNSAQLSKFFSLKNLKNRTRMRLIADIIQRYNNGYDYYIYFDNNRDILDEFLKLDILRTRTDYFSKDFGIAKTYWINPNVTQFYEVLNEFANCLSSPDNFRINHRYYDILRAFHELNILNYLEGKDLLRFKIHESVNYPGVPVGRLYSSKVGMRNYEKAKKQGKTIPLSETRQGAELKAAGYKPTVSNLNKYYHYDMPSSIPNIAKGVTNGILYFDELIKEKVYNELIAVEKAKELAKGGSEADLPHFPKFEEDPENKGWAKQTSLVGIFSHFSKSAQKEICRKLFGKGIDKTVELFIIEASIYGLVLAQYRAEGYDCYLAYDDFEFIKSEPIKFKNSKGNIVARSTKADVFNADGSVTHNKIIREDIYNRITEVSKHVYGYLNGTEPKGVFIPFVNDIISKLKTRYDDLCYIASGISTNIDREDEFNTRAANWSDMILRHHDDLASGKCNLLLLNHFNMTDDFIDYVNDHWTSSINSDKSKVAFRNSGKPAREFISSQFGIRNSVKMFDKLAPSAVKSALDASNPNNVIRYNLAESKINAVSASDIFIARYAKFIAASDEFLQSLEPNKVYTRYDLNKMFKEYLSKTQRIDVNSVRTSIKDTWYENYFFTCNTVEKTETGYKYKSSGNDLLVKLDSNQDLIDRINLVNVENTKLVNNEISEPSKQSSVENIIKGIPTKIEKKITKPKTEPRKLTKKELNVNFNRVSESKWWKLKVES